MKHQGQGRGPVLFMLQLRGHIGVCLDCSHNLISLIRDLTL